VGKNQESLERKAFLMDKRFNVVPLCNTKWHVVATISSVLYGIMEICPEFDVSRDEFTGENRETLWKRTFDFKRLNTSK
jgi:hypothetical protein